MKGEAVKTIVGDELAVIMVITELPTLFDGGHSSDAIKKIVIKNIASNIVRGTGYRRISRH